MSLIRLQGEDERRRGIYYQVNSDDQPIGVGGMGQVFKGMSIDERTGVSRAVAIKFIFSDLPPNIIERARREASIQLRNDNLVEMLGFIETEEMTTLGMVLKHYHVVSELLTGVSLDNLLEGKTKDRDGNDVQYAVKLYQDYQKDPEHFARKVVMSVLSGLMALHDAGYIHRDIDPSNIMVTVDGHIKLIDFGIAKQMNTLTTNDKGLTVAGKFMGKPEYASPELVLGDISHQNQTTDIYAVGILLYQCIVGHTPYEGARHEILQKQLKEKLPLSKVKNRAMRDIIARACEKNQVKRFQTSAQMRVALELMSTPKHIDWKKIVPLCAAAACLLGIGLWLLTASGNDEPLAEQVQQSVAAVPPSHYVQAVVMLKEPSQAEKGLQLLEDILSKDKSTLSQEERSEYAAAAYLVSRLYFKSKATQDYLPDSIRQMQQNLQLAIDYKRSHELLLTTIELNPDDYHALYELGCDFLGGKYRTEAVERDRQQADAYFQKALQIAKERSDSHYTELIEEQMDKYSDDM